MKYPLYLLIVFLLLQTCYSPLGAQQLYGFDEDEDFSYVERMFRDTVYLHDTIYISHLDEVTALFNRSFYEFSQELLQAVEEADSANLISLEQLYLNYLIPMYYPSYMDHRYILRDYRVELTGDFVKIKIQNLHPINPLLADSVAADILVTFRGDAQTREFLRSTFYRSTCLEQLFLSINAAKGQAIKGINFYFPDFDFKEKRALAQFVKSVSLVIDSCHMPAIRDLRLYISFDRQVASGYTDYLCALTQMADSILLVNSRTAYWTRDTIQVLTIEDAKRISWLSKVKNQLYLARFHPQAFPETHPGKLTPANLRLLINSDYPNNNWKNYFYVLAGIFLFLFICCLLYRWLPAFSSLIHNHMIYFFSFILILVIEVYVLFVCMIEEMSNEHVFFPGRRK
ncbi:MAG: hypothetical protein LIO97_07145 [Tannerellaceae bacterium]|nr:hypothetical protein [Tannerellaceae bacterium]